MSLEKFIEDLEKIGHTLQKLIETHDMESDKVLGEEFVASLEPKVKNNARIVYAYFDWRMGAYQLYSGESGGSWRLKSWKYSQNYRSICVFFESFQAIHGKGSIYSDIDVERFLGEIAAFEDARLNR